MPPWPMTPAIIMLAIIALGIFGWIFNKGRDAARTRPRTEGMEFDAIIGRCPACGFRCEGWSRWEQWEKDVWYRDWLETHKSKSPECATSFPADNQTAKHDARAG